MLFLGRYHVMLGVSYAGGGMLFIGAERAFCSVSSRGDAFGCTSDPVRIVSCAGDSRFGIFS